MALAAHLEDAARNGAEPREPRRKLRLEVPGSIASGVAANVLVHNISATGMLLESEAPLAPNERFEIDLPDAGATRAKVIWTSGKLFGCAFEKPISAATLSAAQLRSAVRQDVELAERSELAFAEPFGARLARLRKERGLTLAQIARALGVSKPTVWAWEQGKAKPVESRLGALANVLGVSSEDLLSSAQGSGARDLIARSREEIARAFGISRDKIRIMIEL